MLTDLCQHHSEIRSCLLSARKKKTRRLIMEVWDSCFGKVDAQVTKNQFIKAKDSSSLL